MLTLSNLTFSFDFFCKLFGKQQQFTKARISSIVEILEIYVAVIIKVGHSNQATQISVFWSVISYLRVMVSRKKRSRIVRTEAFTLGQRPHYIRILESFSDSDSPLNGPLNFLKEPIVILFSTFLKNILVHESANA